MLTSDVLGYVRTAVGMQSLRSMILLMDMTKVLVRAV